MQIVKESIIKKHSYESGVHTSYTEVIEQYHYDSEEEKMEHKIEMELNGWNDSGQVMEMISGSLMPGAKNPPVHVWFGSYYKTIKIEVRNVTRRKI